MLDLNVPRLAAHVYIPRLHMYMYLGSHVHVPRSHVHVLRSHVHVPSSIGCMYVPRHPSNCRIQLSIGNNVSVISTSVDGSFCFTQIDNSNR